MSIIIFLFIFTIIFYILAYLFLIFNLIVPKNRTLLLDLDETLIHSCSLKENPDHIVWAKSEYGEESKVLIIKIFNLFN